MLDSPNGESDAAKIVQMQPPERSQNGKKKLVKMHRRNMAKTTENNKNAAAREWPKFPKMQQGPVPPLQLPAP